MSCDSCNDASIDITNCKDGKNGQYGGYSSRWLFDGSTAVGPASNYFRFNNTTYSLVTNIYISDTNADNTLVSDLLDSFANTLNFGTIRIFKEFDSNTFWYGKITNVVDNGAYHTLTVTFVESNNSFSSNDSIVVTFSPAGQQGIQGVPGAPKFYTHSITTDSEYKQASANTYTTLAQIIWVGTTQVGNPTQIRFNAWSSDVTEACAFRVYDVTNSQVIAEQTSVTNTSTANIINPSTTTLGNLSTGYAIWQIQAHNTSGGGAGKYARIASLMLGFY